ncbi:MAG: molybdopterin-binding protein [Actinomycetota bacterium]|nr:molybdopterin-binding protein [Actinomycetota bacterium]
MDRSALRERAVREPAVHEPAIDERPRSMTTVLMFARARELAGTKTTEIDGATVADVLRVAGDRYGDEFVALSDTCSVVVDGEVVLPGEFSTRAPGAELAILPPVSGGAGEGPVGAGEGPVGAGEGPVGAGEDDIVEGDLPKEDGGSDDHHRYDAPSIGVAVLTVSDRAARGQYEDLTGPSLEVALLDALDAEIVARAIVPDEFDRIVEVVREWCDGGLIDLVVTTGGTGMSPRDITPEAIRSLLDVEAPGLAELMRARGLEHTPMAALSRQVVGRRGATVVAAVPGSVNGAVESIEAILAVLPHAIATAGERS